MRLGLLLSMLAGLMAAAVTVQPADAQPADAQPARAQPASGPAAPAVTPRIVVQAVSQAGTDVAAWSADGRQLYSASGLGRDLLVWDVATGTITDRLRLGSPPGASVEYARLKRMQLSADGTSVTIDGEVLDKERYDLRAPRRYVVDLVSRRVTLVPAAQLPPLPPLPAGQSWQQQAEEWLTALGTVQGDRTGMSLDTALRVLPALPRSPDGRFTLSRAANGLTLTDGAGTARALETPDRMGSVGDAELSPNDRYLAILTLDELPVSNASRTPVEVLDLATGAFLPRVDAAGSYDMIKWLDRERYALLPQDPEDDPQASAAEGEPDLVRIINAASGTELGTLPSRCFMAVLPGGRLVGAGLANCRKNAGTDRTLVIADGGRWQPLPGFSLDRGEDIRLIAASPVGNRIAVVVRRADKSLAVLTVNLLPTPGIGPGMEMEVGTELTLISFSPDGRQLWLAGEGSLMEWTIDAPGDALKIRELPGEVLWPQRMASNGTRLMVGGPVEERIIMVELASGAGLRPVAFPGAASVGYMRSLQANWAASTTEGIRFWDVRSGRVLMTINLLPGSRYVVYTPEGRYDTNVGPDADLFRWVISDEPRRALPPQTLMRDFYEPRLIAKLIDCTRAGNCAQKLHPVPPIAGLNRQLPLVTITAVRPAGPGRAEVDVTVSETRDPDRGIASGVYGVKLLMNNREIARNPDETAPLPPGLAAWRRANFTPAGDDRGRRFWTFSVPIPTDGSPIDFAAYSFNADRVKSDTASRRWQPPPQPRRPRRAYILTIGVNDYAERRLNLNFAVPDAELLRQRLARLPGLETRHASLTSSASRPVTSDDVMMALLILAGASPAALVDTLRANGHDASALAEATPDDVVIISFSGHGYADATGSFGLLASDVRWPALARAPDPDTMISAERLTMALRAIKAGEIAFIIDACHSGAAVNTPDFKPGPMGDPGLGQLAFDKGLRILAATQADDVALENPRLSHGLLTAALGEGLDEDLAHAAGQSNYLADFDKPDGSIWLDEWLRYAVARLPSLEAEVRRGGGPMLARGVRLVLRGEVEEPRSQLPSLFDFNKKDSPVLLRGRP